MRKADSDIVRSALTTLLDAEPKLTDTQRRAVSLVYGIETGTAMSEEEAAQILELSTYQCKKEVRDAFKILFKTDLKSELSRQASTLFHLLGGNN